MCSTTLMPFYGEMEIGKVLVTARKTISKGHFPRTYVIESTNFQVRGQRKSKPVYGHQGTKNSWDAFTSFTCVSQVGLLFRNKEHGGKI